MGLEDIYCSWRSKVPVMGPLEGLRVGWLFALHLSSEAPPHLLWPPRLRRACLLRGFCFSRLPPPTHHLFPLLSSLQRHDCELGFSGSRLPNTISMICIVEDSSGVPGSPAITGEIVSSLGSEGGVIYFLVCFETAAFSILIRVNKVMFFPRLTHPIAKKVLSIDNVSKED